MSRIASFIRRFVLCGQCKLEVYAQYPESVIRNPLPVNRLAVAAGEYDVVVA